jgi:hypothetical protein
VFLGGVAQKPGDAYTVLSNSSSVFSPQILFSEAPKAGVSCDIRIVTTEDEESTVEVVSFTLEPNFDGVQTSFTINPSNSALTDSNSFVFLSGVEQNPFGNNQNSPAYTITHSGGVSTFAVTSPQA